MKVKLPPLSFIPFLMLYLLTLGYLTIDYTCRRDDGRLFDITLYGWQDSAMKDFIIIVLIICVSVGLANYAL